MITIRQTFVHLKIQDGAKTKLSRSRFEIPQLLLAVLAAWRKETVYAEDGDCIFIFPSKKLGGVQPRSGSMLVEDYLRPAAIRARDEGENPAVVQAIMRHAKLDMTLYYSHSGGKQKLAAQEKVLRRTGAADNSIAMTIDWK